MMMTVNPVSNYLAPALLALSALLSAWNWYLQPGRAVFWLVALLLLCGMTAALRVAMRRSKNEAVQTRSTKSISNAVVFAGLMVTLALTGSLAHTYGVPVDANLPWRAIMVVAGVFLVVTGNAIPKSLTPLSIQRSDPARVQAFQRFAGWTWVLIGLAFALVWVALPVKVAHSVSYPLLLGGILVIRVQTFRLCRMPRTEK